MLCLSVLTVRRFLIIKTCKDRKIVNNNEQNRNKIISVLFRRVKCYFCLAWDELCSAFIFVLN